MKRKGGARRAPLKASRGDSEGEMDRMDLLIDWGKLPGCLSVKHKDNFVLIRETDSGLHLCWAAIEPTQHVTPWGTFRYGEGVMERAFHALTHLDHKIPEGSTRDVVEWLRKGHTAFFGLDHIVHYYCDDWSYLYASI